MRVIIKLYIAQQAQVSWSGCLSGYFPILNGVRQGGVLSPLLYCVYIDQLLVRLSQSGSGCFIGRNFVGALAYADDIVLVCPTASAMRKLLSICDAFAGEYDMKFNALKSKLLVCLPRSCHNHRPIANDVTSCQYFIGGNVVECVDSFLHLGHVITSSLNDKDDISHRRNCFINQVNNVHAVLLQQTVWLC